MIGFWLSVAIMIAIAVWMVVPPLLGRSRSNQLDQNQQNIRIARERLAELEAEHHSGAISDAEFEAEKGELEKTLLNDVEQQAGKPLHASSADRKSIVAVAISVPVLAIGLYLSLGTPDVMELLEQHAGQQGGQAGANGGLPSVDEMVGKLEERLKQQPDDAQGWFTLGRSYMSVGRYADAVRALEKVYQLAGDHPAVLLSYADALIMANNGEMQGKPFELVKRALEIQPDNPTGLWLAGIGYQEQGDDRTAISYWQKLLPLISDDAASVNEVRALIAKSRQRLGEEVATTTDAKTTVASIQVSVNLDAQWQDKVNAGDTVFVFATAAQGPPMPLAVARKQVKDLPFTVTLDDSMAMMPSMKLSNFAQVKVSARISKSGQASAQAGDIEAGAVIVDVKAAEPVKLTINKQRS